VESIGYRPRNGRPKKYIDPTVIVKRTDWAAVALATAGGAGFSPKAPGTAGSVVCVFFYLLI